MLSRTAQSSFVQVEVKAAGKNNNTTGCPRSMESVTGFLAVLYSVKSGAVSFNFSMTFFAF
jgi:hypothetical protein